MPMVSLATGCAAATPATPSATVTHARRSLMRISEPIDPLLGVDPALQIAGLHATRLGLGPRVVGILGPAELIVDDAEVDQRLGWIAAHVLQRGETGLAERERGAVHRDPA